MADDLMQLQRQAAMRVRRMQEHSRQVFESHQPKPPPPAEPEPTPPPSAEEGDRLLILGLAVLLAASGCRRELLLALLYLAL